LEDKDKIPSAVSVGGKSTLANVFQALRPHQWLKNVLIAVPAIAAHQTAIEPLGYLLVAAIAFSLCASAGYILNDLFDREHDRQHPRKKHRPFSRGALSPTFGVVLALGLLVSAILISLALPRSFLAVICAYFAVTLCYSSFLKQLLMIDVVVLACLYGLRVIAGGVATGIMLSEWLIAFCVFFFVSLALVKRSAEIRNAMRELGTQLPGRGYKVEDLPVILALAAAAGFVSVLILALYLDSPNVRAIYTHPSVLWGVGLILIFWIGRVVLLTGRGDMHDDPVVFAVTDKISLASVAAAGAVLVLSS
jgi:4-hydroxybenzoate polyprenyltransferase